MGHIAIEGHARRGHLSPVHVRMRGQALERAGDLAGALEAYEAALQAAPEDVQTLSALASLAHRMQMPQAAERLWSEVGRLDPARLDAVDGRARALREMGAFEASINLLREALLANRDDARLWNSLGVTLMQDSQPAAAITFLDEAARLDPRYAQAVYNRGSARFDLGDLEAAAKDFATARKLAKKPEHAAMIDFAAATLALARGELAAGWAGYETRLSRHWADAPVFEAPGRRWLPGAPLAGRHLLAVAEQGLGDEIMFANLVPDLIEALGPQGQLSLAVEPRLVALFQRSFPAAAVSAHATDKAGPRPRRSAPGLDHARPADLWAPLGSLPRQFRTRIGDFPAGRGGYLKPDPARVAHWRQWLQALGDGAPAVGVSWRSGKVFGDRRRQYPPRDLWAPLLRTPGVRFVNLQYGDCDAELAAFRAQGCEVAEPPGLDLKDDIDELAALLSALDLVVCAANATAALAGACGGPLALIGAPAAWPKLGTDAYPWYPQARALTAPAFGDWDGVMEAAQGLVAGLVSIAHPGESRDERR
ncbi:tetratricopeptide repeat protein [Phenylobacterium sp.]|jgi:tetratricopeptide (TPR) repeat protein|uniref:CHAT domain-containing protein n=1 Tax=Phenylobacterium sp. TaxID=1871053 RepID=UPI002F3F169E